MTTGLQLRHAEGEAVDVLTPGGKLLWRYVYSPHTPAQEAPRPYAHPVYSLAGDLLTNFRPHDHPWHHALSFTATMINGVNFWGGPTFDAGAYNWRTNHGVQRHRDWTLLEAGAMTEAVDWIDAQTGRVLLAETRQLETALVGDGWQLRWSSELRNVSGEELALGNYEAPGGLTGSHYTGLQFRGARDLLDDYGDARIGISAPEIGEGEAAVHGAVAPAIEWSCRHDGSLRRTRIRFEARGDVKWFVRRKNPLAAAAFHHGAVLHLPPAARQRFDHTLSFTPLS